MQILTIPGLFTLLYINDLVPNSETLRTSDDAARAGRIPTTTR
jgi:hypothetical protein